MQKLCNSPNKGSRGLFAVNDIIQINGVNTKSKSESVERKSSFSTSILYNFSYGLVNTHVEKYIFATNICQEENFVESIKNRWGLMDIGERIRHIRKLLGLTQKEFAQQIGITQGFLTNVEKGRYQPSEKVLRLISQTFGVSLEWLKTGQGEMWVRKDKALLEGVGARLGEIAEKLIRIPVVEHTGVGFPKNPADIEVAGYILVSRETLQKGGRFSVKVRGDHMEPTLRDGDIVVFKPYVGDVLDIPNGKVVVVRNIGGELIVKRLIKIDGKALLMSDNPKYPPIPPEIAQEEELRIVGIGVEAIKRVEL
jgi:phage repressor protein C with HTH and peptisase S24 domain